MAQLDPAWTPRVPARTLLSERCSLIGLFISALAYGITIPFAVMSMQLLYRSIDSTNRKAKFMWMTIVGFLFVCGTIYASSLLVMAELAFSTYREFPGGPTAFERAFRGLPVNTAGLVFFIMSTWICDAVMVWRFFVLFRTSVCRIPLWALMIIPCAGWITGLVLGILWLLQVTTPYGRAFNISEPFFLTSVFLNVLISASLVGRLLWYRRKISKALGLQKGLGVQYTHLASMLVEAAIPYMLFSLGCFIFFTLKTPLLQPFESPFGLVQIASTMMIIFRVAIGSAWSSNTASDVMKEPILDTAASVRSASSTTPFRFFPDPSPVSEKGTIQSWTVMSHEDMV